ncbi:class II aldolase/adducin family protein [Methylocapsa sp. S129]|uniref:class II aldolase/adducin family protein n=1 Tax=Methylocapsa sp. S129 TaxID=1641869 RepID=UPI001575FFC4|nr:class II aldolase/adducin family protein [Methylocapsa sp. S129]
MIDSAEARRTNIALLIDELVDANHILFHQNVVDGFGHVSARHPERADRFFLSRSMAPALVRSADILEFDLDGAVAEPDGRAVYLERFIHSEIYRARPDVAAVVHSHSASVIPFGVVRNAPLRAISHMCGFLGEGAPVFEIRDAAGDGTDLLIRNRALGAALAKSLQGAAAVLMRGHGATMVGTSLRQAVFRAVYTETGARLQAEALRLGPVTFLTAAEAAAAAQTNDAQINRAWDLWRVQARAHAGTPQKDYLRE